MNRIKIVVLGNGLAGINVVLALLKFKKVDIVYITQSIVREIKHIPVYLFRRFDVEKIIIASFNPDIVISAGWNKKLSKEVISTWDCYNIHPSLLPAYRGRDPINRQLSNHEAQGGITMHKMDENYDTGPIFMQVKFKLTNTDDVRKVLIRSYKFTYEIIKEFVTLYPNIVCVEQEIDSNE